MRNAALHVAVTPFAAPTTSAIAASAATFADTCVMT
jgi:hypothetical protein